MAVSTDDQTFKIGDGVTAWSDLPQFINATDVDEATLATLASAKTYTDSEILALSTTLSQDIIDASAVQVTYTDTKIAELIDSAPSTLDTLNEIATAIQASELDIDAITVILQSKADANHTHTLDDLSDVSVATATDQQVIYFDSSDSTWKTKTLVGIDAITVSTSTAVDGGSLSYDNVTGEFTYNPAVTGVTAGNYAMLEATGPFAASTGSFHTYNDGSQNLEVTVTTTISYVNLISLTSDHICTSYAAAKLFRVVGGVETEIFHWSIIIGKDFSWTIYDEHNLEPGTEITYRIKGQGVSATSYIGQNADVQLWVQEVAGALGGQPTSPDITVETAASGSTTGGLSYVDGTLTYTPVLPAAAALSELTDVDLTTLGDGDVLAYDATSSTWLPGSAASSVAQLTDVDLSAGTFDGQVLGYVVGTGWVPQSIVELIEFEQVDIAPSLVEFNEQTAQYTLALSDKDKMVEMNVSSATDLYIPDNATVAFPIGTTITVMQKGAGQISILGVTGVTVYYTPSQTTRTQYSSVTLVKRDTNTWYLMGDLE